MSFTGYGCNKIVGFLFPHRCDRLSAIGCPYCANRSNLDEENNYFQMRNHPYKQERSLYPNFGEYDSPAWSAVIDFTQADGASLVNIEDFEMDFGAS
ncbi:MAG: hypothetical protein ACK4QL_03760 [Pseudanabaenaceae cyanobacterium]